jgi:hypothetical protein
MRKIATITALLTAVAVVTLAAPASGAVLLAKSCYSSCSMFSATGGGNLGIVANGAEWGSATSGTIWVRDRSGKDKARSWVSGSGIHWKYLGHDGWKGTFSHTIKLNAWGKFWVKLRSPGIAVSAVVDGSGSIAGNGTYHLKGHGYRWPYSTTQLHF